MILSKNIDRRDIAKLSIFGSVFILSIIVGYKGMIIVYLTYKIGKIIIENTKLKKRFK